MAEDILPPLPKGFTAINDENQIPPLPKGFTPIEKKKSGLDLNNTSHPSSGGLNSFLNSPQSTISYAPITDPNLRQEVRNRDIDITNQQIKSQQDADEKTRAAFKSGEILNNIKAYTKKREQRLNDLQDPYTALPIIQQENQQKQAQQDALDAAAKKIDNTEKARLNKKYGDSFWGNIGAASEFLGSKLKKGAANSLDQLLNAGEKIRTTLGGTPMTEEERNLYQEDIGRLNKLAQGEVTQGYEGSNKFSRAVGGLTEALPSLVSGGLTGSSTFYLEQLGQGAKDIQEAKDKGININPAIENAYVFGKSIIGGKLMNSLNSHTLFPTLPSAFRNAIADKATVEVMNDLLKSGEKVTADNFSKAFVDKAATLTERIKTGGLPFLKEAVKGYLKAGADLTALNTSDAMEKLATNKASGKDVFDVNPEQLGDNLKKIWTEDAPLFGAIGAIRGSGGILFDKSPFKSGVVESLREDNSPENVQNIKEALQKDVGGNIEPTLQYVDKLSQTISKLPKGIIPEHKFNDAVDIVSNRDNLQDELNSLKQQRESTDPAFEGINSPQEQLLSDKIEQANDKLKDIATGSKTTYSKGIGGEEGKFFKNFNGKKEEISESRYDLENTERESKKQSNEQSIESTLPESNVPETPQTNEAGVPETTGEKPIETTENNVNINPENNESSKESNRESEESNSQVSPESGSEENNGLGQERNVENSGVEQSTSETTKPKEKKSKEAPAIKNENTKERAEKAGIELEDHVGETRTKEVVDKEATKAIKEGYDSHELVRKILEDKHQASDTEVAILAKHTETVEKNYQDLTKKLADEGATMNKHDFDKLTSEQEQATKDYQDALNADVKTGTATARGLSARRFAVKNNFSLGQMIKNKRAANGGEKLSTEQVNEVNARFKEIQEANDKLQARIDKLESDNAKIKAEKTIKRIRDGEARLQKKAVTKEALAEDRKKIAQEFSEKLKKMRQGGALNSVGKATVEFLQAAAPYVAKMVRNLTLEGITEIKDVVLRIKEELDLKDLSDREVTDLISGVYNEQKVTKSDLEAQIRDLKTQARLMGEIEDAEAGLAKSKTPKPKISEKVKELRQRLDELQKGTPLTKEEQSLKQAKANAERRIKELTRRIDQKDFSKVEPTKIQPDAELIDLRRKADRLMENYQLQLAKDELANRTKVEKLKDNLLNIASLPRALKASLDFSAVLRQGLFATAGHPKEVLTAFREMFRQTFSEEKYKNWISDLKHEPIYDLMQKSDLYLSDKNNPKLLAKEEEFTSNLADKIPGIGKLIAGSERAYTGYLNVLRAGVFTSEAQKLIQKGYKFENNPEQFKALAKVVNVLTGRGDIPEFLGGKQPKILSSALFSPRFMAARIQTLYLWADPRLPREAKILAAKDIGSTLASGALILSLASLAGYKVQTDPRSVNFLRIEDKQEKGSSYYDILGGLPQYVRFLAQQGLGQKIPVSGNGVITFGSKKARGTTRLSEASRFMRGKLSPLTGGVLNLMEEKDVIGQPYHLWPNVPLEFVPLPFTDVQDAYKIGGIDAAIKAFIPSQFGIGVSSYDPNSKQKKF